MRWQSKAEWLGRAWLGLACCAAMACGDDGDARKPEAPKGEPCPAAGINMTGCVCANDRPLGSRRCLEELVWSECSCPPRDDRACRPGQNVRCDVCMGEVAGRIVECAQDGTYDCSCTTPEAGAPLDAGTQPDAATQPTRDAG